MAWGKLSERITGRPILFTGQRAVNLAILLANIACGIMFVFDPGQALWLYLAILLSATLGVMTLMPIGGADMPVVISLLNSYSGLAACAAGFVISNNVLIVAGCTGRGERHHPHQDHVQGDEPLSRQRALQRIRCRLRFQWQARRERSKPLSAEDAYLYP